MGERKTIYVQDGLWAKLAKEASSRNISISQLILNPWLGDESQLDRIEAKIDSLIPGSADDLESGGFFNPQPKCGKK